MNEGSVADYLAAHWSEQAVYAAWIAILVNAVGLAFVFRQIQQNSRAIRAATEATRVAVAETRPWLELTMSAPTFSFRGDDADQKTSAEIAVTMTNVGKTPAISAVLTFEIVPDASESSVANALISPRPLSFERATLFPGRSAVHRRTLKLGARAQRDVFYVLASATYHVPGGDQTMRTPTVFEIRMGELIEPNHSDPDSYEFDVFDGSAYVYPQQHVPPT